VADDPGRTERKRTAITEAATELFLRDGYRGTSMEDIATAAGVSKQTVYKQFADKEQLFCRVVEALVNAASDPVHEALRGLEITGDIEVALSAVARRQLELVLEPRLMQLRRLVIAEATRFPQLGKVFFDQGPRRTIEALAEAFAQLGAEGSLRVDDPAVAATHFNWLVMGEPLSRAMLLGLDRSPSAKQIDHWATTGVRTFVAAFGGHGASSVNTGDG
jgi:TetR/AcrR family transcriptional regulator, mexJK operon transcriptional repressor